MPLDVIGLALVMAALSLVLQGVAHGSREGWEIRGRSGGWLGRRYLAWRS